MLTQASYRASRRPEVQALLDMGKTQERVDKARSLADQGFIIDMKIDGYGYDAGLEMGWRLYMGFKWMPSYDQPMPSSFADFNDLSKMPKGGIKSSVDDADYPSLDPVVTPAPVSHDEVGQFIGNGLWEALNQWDSTTGAYKHPAGFPIQHNGKTLYFQKVQGPFGVSIAWNEVKP